MSKEIDLQINSYTEAQGGKSEKTLVFENPGDSYETRNERKRLTPKGKDSINKLYLSIQNTSILEEKNPRPILRNLLNELIPEEHKPLRALVLNSLAGKIIYQRAKSEYDRLAQDRSPWIETLSQIRAKAYPSSPEKFFNNFSLLWLHSVRQKIKDVVIQLQGPENQEELLRECDSALTEKIKNTLESPESSDSSRKGRLNSILSQALGKQSLEDFVKNIISQRQTEKVGPSENNQEELLEAVVGIEDEESQEMQEAPSGFKVFRERFNNSLTNLRQKINEVKNFAHKNRKKILVAVTSAIALIGVSYLSNISQNTTSEKTPNPTLDKIASLATSQVQTQEPPKIIYTSTPHPPQTSPVSPIPTERPKIKPTETPTPEGVTIEEGKPLTMTLQTGEDFLDLSVVPFDYKKQIERLKSTGILIEQMKQEEPNSDFPRALILKDDFGKIWVLVDSGYKGRRPLGAEDERKKIEGGDINGTTPLLTPEEAKRNLENLVGNEVKIGDGSKMLTWEVAGAVLVPHEMVEEFSQSTNSAWEVIIRLTGGANSPFVNYRENASDAIIYVFCGWGPKDKEGWWSWTRYVLIISPKIESKTPPPKVPIQEFPLK